MRRRLEKLVAGAHRTIGEMFEVCPDAYIALSGGKDSTVLTRLVLDVNPDALVVHSYHPDNETPEAERIVDALRDLWGFELVRADAPSLIEMYAELGVPETLEANQRFDRKYVQRLRRTHDHLGGGTFLGLRADESRGRAWNRRRRGLLYRYDETRWHCCPLGDWRVEDVWSFIVLHRLPYADIYDNPRAGGWRRARVGDWSGTTGAEWGRLTELKVTKPELWNRLVARVPEVSKWG
jgi:3'-phosphoadenosine 5'-phosphosulfate sulfotransferase (PAPS reductase)/FAD synthetase